MAPKACRAAAPTLPDEVIVAEILTRLPVKLVVSFRSVCKLWNSLLSQPSYIQSLLNCSISGNPNDDYLLLLKSRNSNGYVRYSNGIPILSRSNLSEISIDINLHKVCNQDVTRLVGSINGLVCIACYSKISSLSKFFHFILWNPVMNLSKKISLPKDRPFLWGRLWRNLLGFGWDSVANNYKIVVHSTASVQAVVYSCETDSWSDTVVYKFGWIAGNYVRGARSINVKGICYWNFSAVIGQVIKFEARNNEITCLRLPGPNSRVILVNLNDCLARMEYNGEFTSDMNIDMFCFNEECSLWSKIYRVNIRINDLQYSLSCFKNGGIIVLTKENNLYEYNVYDPKSNEIKSLACCNKEGYGYKFDVPGISYTPSLVALEGMKSFASMRSLKTYGLL